MDPQEIARRLEEMRERIRAGLADAPPGPLSAEAPELEALRLSEPTAPHQLTSEPNLNSSEYLESANERATITAPVTIESKAPVVGPLLNLLRRMARPFVQPFIDPYLGRQERFNADLVRHLNELGRRLELRLTHLIDDLRAYAVDPNLLEARLDSALASYDHGLRQRHSVLFDALEEELWAVQNLLRDGIGGMQSQMHDFEVRFVQRAQAVDARFEEKDAAAVEAGRALEGSLRGLEARMRTPVAESELLETRAALSRALDEVGKARGGSGAGPADAAGEPAAWARLRDWIGDADYRAHQDRFRGDEAEVSARMQAHVQRFAGVSGPVADLGCGRGEFLELLHDAGIDGIGVEINEADVHECVERGLKAEAGDLFDWLQARDPASLGGIFMAQVIEHLPPRRWAELVNLAATRLAPGGVLVIETVNPESLYAYQRAYLLDPTHTRPVHPELLAFLARRNGFATAAIEYQAPVPAEERLAPIRLPETEAEPALAELVRHVNERLARIDALCFGPQEYALVATRAGAERPA